MAQTQTHDTFSFEKHFLFWLLLFVVFAGVIWLFKASLTPFILGAAIAYLLEPIVERLHKYKCPRWLSSAGILVVFFAFVFGAMAIALPFIHKEILRLIENFPDYMDRMWDASQPLRKWAEAYISEEEIKSFRSSLQDNSGQITAVGKNVLSVFVSSTQAFFNTLSIIFITPLVAFFMMKEWTAMTNWVDDLIPRKNYDMIKDLLKEINGKVSGFVRGQLSIAFILAVVYALALTIAGLNYGFLIGFAAGLLSVIPLLGSTLGLIVSLGVAWFQSYEITYTLIIAAIFVAGQIVEGNILTPKLLGKSVGLHPLWILFALIIGGGLFGIVGMLLAVPVAATIGVLLAFGIRAYKKSEYYLASRQAHQAEETNNTANTETDNAQKNQKEPKQDKKEKSKKAEEPKTEG